MAGLLNPSEQSIIHRVSDIFSRFTDIAYSCATPQDKGLYCALHSFYKNKGESGRDNHQRAPT